MPRCHLLILCLLTFSVPAQEEQPTLKSQDSGTTELLIGVDFVDSRNGFIVGGNRERGTPSVLLRTTDGGENWSRVDTGLDLRLYGVHFPTPQIGWVCGIHGALLRTGDGGDTWESVAAPELGDPWFAAVHFVDAKTGFLVGGREEGRLLLRTVDGGHTWRSLKDAMAKYPGLNLRDVLFIDHRFGFVCGTEGLLLRTTDGGEHWKACATGTKVWLKSLSFPSPSTGFVAGGGGTVLRTDDGGKTWRALDFPSASKIHAIAFASRERGWAASTHGGLWCTIDGGTTWQTVSAATGELTALHLSADGSGWVVGGRGTVMKIVR